jgi:hypothetical protein
MTFQPRSDRTRTDNSDNPPKRSIEFPNPPSRTHAVGQRTCLHRPWVIKHLHKVASFVRGELIMGPEGIVEGEIPEFFLIVFVEETGGGSDHVHTQLTVKRHFSLIEGPHSHSHFHTHFK